MSESRAELRTRLLAAVGLLAMIVLAPANMLWFGLPVLWRDYPKEARRQWLTLLCGKRGPYRGVTW